MQTETHVAIQAWRYNIPSKKQINSSTSREFFHFLYDFEYQSSADANR